MAPGADAAAHQDRRRAIARSDIGVRKLCVVLAGSNEVQHRAHRNRAIKADGLRFTQRVEEPKLDGLEV